MFLFESSKEKAIREDVEKSMETCISNPKKYNEAKDILAAHLRGSDQKVIEMIVDNIKATIKNEDYQPVRKYQAMLLLKDLMLTHNKALGKYVVKKILKRLTILAQHKSGTKEFQRQQQRARDIFGSVKKDQEQYAIRFFNTLLTALEQWGKNWPKAPDGPYKDFHREYNELLMNGVQFPKQRPKQLNKSITGGGRVSRQQPRMPSKEQLSPPKPKPKQEKPAIQQPRPQRKSESRQLRNHIDQFYEKAKEPLNLLNELLPAFASDELPVITDIVGQIQKTIEAGNQLIIQIEGDPEFKNDQLKLTKCFDFVTKVQKDLRILSKKPEQLEVFKSKYVKLSNQLLQTLAKSRTSNSISPIKTQEQKKPSPSPQSRIQAKSQEKVEQKPKIKNQNRYASVQGNQVIQNFAKTAEFQSNSGQSVHSDRFGSFGGPANTDRHRASIPPQAQGGSPQNDQNKKKSNSDRKQSQNKSEKNKQIPVILQENTFQMSKKQLQSGNAPKLQKKLESKQQFESQKMFKQFEAQRKPSEKGSVKNFKPNFEDNSSFGAHIFEKNQPPQQDEEDFFAKVEQNRNQQNKDIHQNPRRKKNQPKQDNEDFFKVRIESQIDSSKLSGFEFSQKGDASKTESKNNQNPQTKPVEASSKKDFFQDNPFGLDTSQNNSKNFGNQSNFLDPIQNRSDVFGMSTVTQKIKTQTNENEDIHRLENPFATGNFGNMIEKPAPLSSVNPFEVESVKSKKEPQNNSLDNPFGNSFDRSSKGSKPAKQSVHSKNSQNKGNLNNSGQNPFSSKGGYNPNDNFFEQRLNHSRNNVQNPFETETQRSNKSKNPFEEVQEFYKQPPPNQIYEGLSQRNSFKNIQSDHKNNILGGNLGLSGFPEPIRDSLVFSAKVDKEVSEYGLNFSRFQDIGAGDNQQQNNTQARNSDPFNVSGRKQDHQFSGFSLSNFPAIGEEQQNRKENQSDPQNVSATDFFANFQKQSLQSKKSKEKVEVSKKQQKPKNTFQDFFANNNSLSNESKSQHKKSNKNSNANLNTNNIYQRQKTVLSGQQKSFDFAQLERISAIQNKKQNNFEVFTEGGKSDNTKRQDKQGFMIDNKSQKSLSWGDFSARPDQIQKQNMDKEQKFDRDSNDDRSNKLLQVESRINIPDPTDRPKEGESKQPTSRVRFSNEPSLDLQLQDFAPVTKKGIQWNPLAKIAKLKESPYTYNVDDKKIELKKAELLEKQKDYNQKLQIFKFAKNKNQQIRVIYMEKMKKIQDIMHQKTEFQQILKKLKETNDLKQNQIQDLYSKIKKAEQIKARLLQKQKQFYELTKNQIYSEQKKSAQRSMASKWQMFNKNLQHNRNSMFTVHSQYTNNY